MVNTIIVDEQEGCVFCDIAAGRAPAKHRGDWISTIVFEPLNPVTPGHLLVAPRMHVRDALEDPRVTATTMSDASTMAHHLSRIDPRYENVNLITSVGPLATQTVMHLHIHIVPRTEGDGLLLPWSGQKGH